MACRMSRAAANACTSSQPFRDDYAEFKRPEGAGRLSVYNCHTSEHNSAPTSKRRRGPLRSKAVVREEQLQDETESAFVLTETSRQVVKSYPSGKVRRLAGPADDSRFTSGFTDFVKSFVLPKGYPDSVSEEYLTYQLRTLPAHVTGWLSKSLATSSLIHALGVGSVGPTGTVAASASIKWITKDGLGAFGRFLVGGRLGGVFDEDPRRWRMIAVGFATVGLAFEIATTAYPSYFIALASIGNFTKAVGRGLSQPCFRLIQNHFAIENNVGDISAKEEVWEVAAQLTGLGSSVVLLRAIEAGGKPEAALWIWLLVQAVHVALRFYSLDSLRFAELNQKRACLLVSAHVQGRPVPDISQANMEEPMLAGTSGVAPHIWAGVAVEDAFDGQCPNQKQLADLREAYREEQYWLIWKAGKGKALLLDGFGKTDMLRLLWQGAWLEAQGVQDANFDDYSASLDALNQHFLDCQQQIQQQGWDVDRSVFKLGEVRIQQQHNQ